ncbi:MAG: hypothetical protein GY870_12390 [archaeon]|nr:hypothetical protein [archaeon]
MINVFDRIDDIVVEINNYPYFRTETIDENRGIVRIYGRDGTKEKLNRVIYSKPYYNEEYVKKYVVPQYDGCQICTIGNDIDEQIKKDMAIDSNNSIVLLSMLGIVSIPLLLYTISKKLTK